MILQNRMFMLGGLLLLVAVAIGLTVLRQGVAEDHSQTIQLIAQLNSSEAQLDNDVLRVVSLRLPQYDTLVDTGRQIDAQRRRLIAVQDKSVYKDTPEIGVLITRYDQQIRQKLDLLEQVKSNAAFVRNEVSYIPFAVSQAVGHISQGRGLQLLEISQRLMSLRVQPTPEVARSLDDGILQISKTDDPNVMAVVPHLRAFLVQQELLDFALNTYVEVNSDATLAELRDRVLSRENRDENRVTVISRLLGGVSVLLLGSLAAAAMMLIRARTAASIEHLYAQRLEAERDQRQLLADELAEKVVQLEETRDGLVQSEKMASLGRMVAGFAHEVNTPIGVAVGGASAIDEAVAAVKHLLEQDELREDALVEQLDTIREASGLTLSNLRRAARLIQSFKRASIDQTTGSCRDYLVSEPLADVLQSLHHFFKRTAIEVKVDCPSTLAAHGPVGAVEQILTNLLMNSYIHAYHDGTVAGTIHIGVSNTPPQSIRIEFIDDGQGMPADVASRIFEPFFTTKRDHGGSGLGLYIVYNLATSVLGGSVSCQSAPGQGTKFQISFPVRIDGQNPMQVTQEDAKGGTP